MDLLGPASALNSVTTRPAETRVFGGTDTWLQPCSAPGKQDGTQLQAVFINAILAQLRALIRGSGITASNADDNMLFEAVEALGIRYAVDAGTTANAIVIAPAVAVSTLSAGLPLRVLVGHSVTGATTIAVSGLAPVALTRNDGTALQSGDLAAGQMIEVAFDGTSFRLQSPKASLGVLAGLRVISTTGTYTSSTGVTAFSVTAIGGGASGGGGQLATPNGAAEAGGGGAGGAVEKLFQVVAGATGACTIGTDGPSSSAGSDGHAGGTTTFVYNGVTLTATGGAGGTNADGYPIGGAGGVGSGGDLNLTGNPGAGGTLVGFPGQSGNGGAGLLGGAGQGGRYSGSATVQAATAGVTGSGGGGGNGPIASGAGGAGLILIREYR